MKKESFITGLIKIIKDLAIKLCNSFARAHYHEYLILDENGDPAGIEFITTRGGKVEKKRFNNNDLPIDNF